MLEEPLILVGDGVDVLTEGLPPLFLGKALPEEGFEAFVENLAYLSESLIYRLLQSGWWPLVNHLDLPTSLPSVSRSRR